MKEKIKYLKAISCRIVSLVAASLFVFFIYYLLFTKADGGLFDTILLPIAFITPSITIFYLAYMIGEIGDGV